MNRTIVRTAGAVAVAGALMGMSSVAASAGDLHYYDSNSFKNKLGHQPCSRARVMHDVIDDRINSIINNTSCDFSGRSWSWVPNTTYQVTYVSSGERIGTLGSGNNAIDHFDRK